MSCLGILLKAAFARGACWGRDIGAAAQAIAGKPAPTRTAQFLGFSPNLWQWVCRAQVPTVQHHPTGIATRNITSYLCEQLSCSMSKS